MKYSLSVGRIAGVAVRIHISALVIFTILVVALAFGQLPILFPDRSTAVYVFASVIAAILFLASLLAHEVSHAVVAERAGIKVESITLWLLGGVARLTGEPKRPGDDLRIAGVGPLMSVALSVIFGGITLGLMAVGVEGMPLGVFAYLAVVNLVLAIFNLVPAAPLDGGRILRAALWARWKDRERAAVAAAKAGRMFGFFLGAVGFLELVVFGDAGGLWFILLGVFLVNAALAEEQQARLEPLLRGVLVRDVMTPDPLTVDGREPVDLFVTEHLLRHRVSGYPVVDEEGRLRGLVTLNRVRAVPLEERAGTVVDDIACPLSEVPTAHPDELLVDVLPRMQGCPDGRAVVIDHGMVVGIVSPTDVSRLLQFRELVPRSPG